MKTLLSLLFLLFALPQASPQQGQKFTVDSEDLAHPLSFKELSKPAPYSVDITRRFLNEKEEHLLQIAEATYPDRDEVLKCQPPLREGESKVEGPRLWWCGDADGARLPFAITKSAVAYYIEFSESERKDETKSEWQPYSNFSYNADISHQESYRVGETTFHDVYVVTMKLWWKHSCGEVPDMCSVIFDKSRKVVLDKTGSVLAVEGDGMPIALYS